ncbi:hypothetical protein [Roseinatronobacter sp.]|uniref:hypothetical protein n=1 Tax=Roseinatronobacter sp. TaxID=1945755 RepID=UPI003F701D12
MNEVVKQPKVARVIDQYKVVLNVGACDGIELGDDFIIYRIGDEVNDPDTGESLGAYEEVIGRGTVTHVQKSMCTLESSDVKQSGRKVIKKFNPSRNVSFALAGLLGNVASEEIIEEGENQKRPFSHAAVGDYAKSASND